MYNIKSLIYSCEKFSSTASYIINLGVSDNTIIPLVLMRVNENLAITN
jgi:hypothetical protein